MAYFKGNSLFPGTAFLADDLSRPWDANGLITPSIRNSDIIETASASLSYYMLQGAVCIHISVAVEFSTLPVTGISNDVFYIYAGAAIIPSTPLLTRLVLDVGPQLACAPGSYTATLDIVDVASNVYIEPTRQPAQGWMTIDGTQGGVSASELLITNSHAFIPHHTYNISGSLWYKLM